MSLDSPYWFEVAVVFGLGAVGNIVLAAFAQDCPAWWRIGKLVTGAGASVLVSATLGREWFFVLVGIALAALAVVHGWWLPKHGVDGITAEPRERYLAFRARRKKTSTRTR